MNTAVQSLPKFANSALKYFGTDATNVRPLRDFMQFEPASEYARHGFLKQDNLPTGQSVRLPLGGTKAASDILASFAAIGTICLVYFQPPNATHSNSQTLVPKVESDTPNISKSTIVSSAAKLIDEAQETSGLTLEMIAPLLGVSRRSIQYWKDGGEISVKNDLKLRSFVDALNQISTGKASETRDLLLTRITGVPRIYDLLAEQRYDTAVLRAKNPSSYKPILSDPTIKFEHRPIEDQLAIVDDVVPTNGFKLNRAMSRRLPSKS